MSLLSDEIDENFVNFRGSWSGQIPTNIASFGANDTLRDSYRRITAIQALKSSVIEGSYSAGACAFFAEAQNDALTSHVFASFGAWRPSLQALRGSIENVLCAHFYADHPIELRLWADTDFRVGFSELHAYFLRHPDIASLGARDSGLEAIKAEYSILSKAVHASAPKFRMTDPAAKILLWSSENAKLSMWATRERNVLDALCGFTALLHCGKLGGAALPGVRDALAFALRNNTRKVLMGAGVHIPTPGG